MAQGDYIAVVRATAEGVVRGVRFRELELKQRQSDVERTCVMLERAARVLAHEPLAELSGCVACCRSCPVQCKVGDLLDEGWHMRVELSTDICTAHYVDTIAREHSEAAKCYTEQRGACSPTETIKVQQAIEWCREFWRKNCGE